MFVPAQLDTPGAELRNIIQNIEANKTAELGSTGERIVRTENENSFCPLGPHWLRSLKCIASKSGLDGASHKMYGTRYTVLHRLQGQPSLGHPGLVPQGRVQRGSQALRVRGLQENWKCYG